jgi:hypothetical protein
MHTDLLEAIESVTKKNRRLISSTSSRDQIEADRGRSRERDNKAAGIIRGSDFARSSHSDCGMPRVRSTFFYNMLMWHALGIIRPSAPRESP